MLLPLETGIIRRLLRDAEAAVSRRFTRIPGPGGTGKVSSVSYTEGTFVLSGLHVWSGQ
jgi:hypothetical protein